MFEKIRQFIRSWKYNTYPARLEIKARNAVLFGCNKALKIFRDDKFRKLMKFEKINEDEQNRIFNELTVTNLVFLMLFLDQRQREAGVADVQEYFHSLRQTVPEYFRGFMRRIKIPEEFAKIWDKLVVLRYEEYEKDRLEVRQEFLVHENLNDLATEPQVIIFQTIAFGLYRHLVRGKLKKDDPLYHFIQPYLFFVYKGYLKKV